MPHTGDYGGLAGRRKRGLPSKAKAGEMLRHGAVHGKALSKAQKGYFGLIAGGGTPTRKRRKRR